MKSIKICKGIYEKVEKFVEDFEISTIKSILGNKKDFIEIFLQEGNNVINHYYNGIILSFDEVLDIIGESKNYSQLNKDIRRHRSLDGGFGINGYGEYRGKILYTPHNKSFMILYKKPNLITDIIPDFVVDNSSLLKIKENIHNSKEFYTKNLNLLNLFHKFVRIIEHYTNIALFDLNFEKFGFDYISVNEFFDCYEAFFEIKNFMLYEYLKESILNKMKKSYNSDRDGILLS